MTEWISCSMDYLCGKENKSETEIRISWKPFGRATMGKPFKENYRYIEGTAYFQYHLPVSKKPVTLINIGGIEHVIAPGKEFKDPGWQLKGFGKEGDLREYGLIFGRKHEDGGFFPVGINVVVEIKE